MMSHLVSAKWKARSLGNVIPSSRVDCAAPPSCRLLLLFTLAIARLIGITNAATTHTIDEVCHDDPAFVDAAYEKRSIAISSNLHPAGFDELMPKTLATATVDRLLHHAHLAQTSGDSVRLAQALAGTGVTPMS